MYVLNPFSSLSKSTCKRGYCRRVFQYCEACRLDLLDGMILLCDSYAYSIGLYYLETFDHGSYSDSTLKEQRRPRVSCASHALKLRKGVVSWHGLAPMTSIDPDQAKRQQPKISYLFLNELNAAATTATGRPLVNLECTESH